MSAASAQVLTFSASAIADTSFYLTRLDGEERLSKPYRFVLDVFSPTATLDPTTLVNTRAVIGIKQGVPLAGGQRRGVRVNRIHGIIETMDVAEQRQSLTHYRVSVVPTISQLRYHHRCRTFHATTVKDMVSSILTTDYAMSEGTEFEFRLGHSWYPKRDYIVQYQETDFDFVSRWLEHEGIFYFFEQMEEGERIVFADDPAAYRPMNAAPTLAYRPKADLDARVAAEESEQSADDWFSEEVVAGFQLAQRMINAEVTLRDYNYREVRDLESTTTIANHGFGTNYRYNEHFKGEGNELARVRADEILSSEKRFIGTSDCRSFRPGVTFTLNDHFRHDFNETFLLTSVHHVGRQGLALETATLNSSYGNEFSAIPADRTYRPPRETAWPSVKGVIHGVITQSVDDQGRYKVRLPFDNTAQDSRWIRMAQPYTGAGFGMHMRLHVGTEVVITHIDGNPDRPIIAGAVPNPSVPSIVSSNNITKNIIRSEQGNTIELDDTPGAESILIATGNRGAVKGYRNRGGGGGGGGAWRRGGAHSPQSKSTQTTGHAAHDGGSGALPADPAIYTGPFAALSPDGLASPASAGIPPHLALVPGLSAGPFATLAPGAGAAAGDEASPTEDEDEFFSGSGASQGNFHTWLDEIAGEGQSASYYRDNAAEFSGVMGTYGYVGDFNVEVTNGHSGSYVNGSFKDVVRGSSHETDIEVEEIGTRIITDNAGTHIYTKYADTEGDQIISGGLSEYTNCPKIYNITTLMNANPGPDDKRIVDSSSVADGEMREETYAKKVKEITTIVGSGLVVDSTTTVTGNTSEVTSITGDATETTTITGTQTETTTVNTKIVSTLTCPAIEETIKGGATITSKTGEAGNHSHVIEHHWGSVHSLTGGAVAELMLGNTAELHVGASESLFLGGKAEFDLGGFFELKAGLFNVAIQIAPTLEIKLGPQFEMGTEAKRITIADIKTKLADTKVALGNKWTALMTSLGF